MRYGVFSDIHSNWEALTTVLEFFKKQKIEGYMCMGDLVGYGPNPNECLQIIRSLPELHIVAGNHDRAAIARKDLGWFNDFAQHAIVWTQKTLTESSKAYLDSLPEFVENAHFTLVHGSPRDPMDEYLLGSRQVQENLEHFNFSPCFVGHSHLPLYFTLEPDRSIHIQSFQENEKIKVTSQVVVINPGSVGQPRDGDSRASCAIYDAGRKTLQNIRLEYPFSKTQEKMRNACLPRYLSERLSFGR